MEGDIVVIESAPLANIDDFDAIGELALKNFLGNIFFSNGEVFDLEDLESIVALYGTKKMKKEEEEVDGEVRHLMAMGR